MFKRLNPISGSSLIASSAYQKWPTGSEHLSSVFLVKQESAHLEFENRSTASSPPKPPIIRSTWHNCRALAILRETSEGTSY